MSADETRIVRDHLDRVLATLPFQRASRLRSFLRFVVEETLAGHAGQLKEYTVGTEVYGRADTFDPRLDATVRVEAHKLRKRLDEYYLGPGADEHVRIFLRAGSYAPEIALSRSPNLREQGESYTRGIELLDQRTPEALELAHNLFWGGLVRFPDYSGGYEGLALYYVLAGAMEILPPTEAWPRARMALAQARALDKTGALTDSVAGILALVSGNRVGAEAAMRKALKTSLHKPAAHFWYSGALSSLGRHTDAVEHMREAASLASRIAPDSSDSILFEAHVGWTLYYAHSYRDARKQLVERFGTSSSNVIVLYLLGRILTELGEYDEAIHHLTRLQAAVMMPISQSALGYAKAKAGMRCDAEAILDQLGTMRHHGYISPVRTAVIHRALAHYEAFADDLTRAEQAYDLIWADVDPQLAP